MFFGLFGGSSSWRSSRCFLVFLGGRDNLFLVISLGSIRLRENVNDVDNCSMIFFQKPASFPTIHNT